MFFPANLSDATGSEQAFVRPVVIIQNNCGNKHSPINHWKHNLAMVIYKPIIVLSVIAYAGQTVCKIMSTAIL